MMEIEAAVKQEIARRGLGSQIMTRISSHNLVHGIGFEIKDGPGFRRNAIAASGDVGFKLADVPKIVDMIQAWERQSPEAPEVN